MRRQATIDEALDHAERIMDEGGDWTKDQKATDIVLTPAACYPLYPTIAKLCGASTAKCSLT